MDTAVSAEMSGAVVQMVIYLLGTIAAVWTFLVHARV